VQIAGIYVITDQTLLPGRSHARIAQAALEGGAKVIQLRDKSAAPAELIQVGRIIRKITAESGALFIVNDSLEAAIACDADGLHVGQGDIPAREIRDKLRVKILGVSVATVEDAVRARDDGADYVGVGPVYQTSTKTDAGPVTGIEMIRSVREACGLPVVAIGGINEGNLPEIARSGADSAAVISVVVCAPDMSEATHKLVQIWEESR
jgi:thiamine-phosphate diphosphorylase